MASIIEDRIEARALRGVEAELRGELCAARKLRRDAIAEHHAIRGKPEGTADYDGSQQEGDGEVLGLLHGERS